MGKYNLINKNNSVTPNYKIDNKDISFNIYVSPTKEVCIIGQLDNNYICWCSMTSLDERETNAAILNYVLKFNQKMISNVSNILGTRYQEVMNWHKLRFYKRVYENEYRYYSPANNVFCGNDEYNNGEFFSSEISAFYEFELSKCEYRLIDNSYITILEKYKNILTQDINYGYYNKMKPIISILESESYIKLCPNEKIRNLYLDCITECSNLYNRYMSAVR